MISVTAWYGMEEKSARLEQSLTVTGAAWRISVRKSVYKKKNKNFCKCQEKILDSNTPFVYDSQGDVMESIVKQSLLYDFYGELLTEHQRSIYEDVVYNDMSLSEIAEENGISRQGVHDLIKRCDKTLSAYEDKLHLISKFQTTRRMVEEIHKKTRIFKETKDESLIDEIEQISNDIMEL